MGWAWNYNGTDTLVATGTGLSASGWYRLRTDDPDSANSVKGQADGSGNLVLTMTAISDPAGGHGDPAANVSLFRAVITKIVSGADTTPTLYSAATVFKYGSASSTGFGSTVAWTFDGATLLTATLVTVAGDDYVIHADYFVSGSSTGSSSSEFTGAGISETFSFTLPSTPGATVSLVSLNWKPAARSFPSEQFVYSNRLFLGGTSSSFTLGNPTGTDSPYGVQPHGVLVSFGDPVLQESPAWTQLDGLTGVSIQHVEINRGRPTERDKAQIGTATITGVCTTGILDPTYAAGAYFGLLDPMKHVKIELQNPTDSTWSSVFRGYVSDWNYDFDVNEKVYTFTIECEDALSIISDAEVIPDVAGNMVPAESTGDVYYDSQAQAGDRITAAIADAGTTFNPYGADWPSGLLSIFTGNVQVKGTVYSPRSSLLGVIDDASDADLPYGNNRWVKRDGTIAFHGRLSRFDPTNVTYGIGFWKVGDAAAFAGDSTTALISGLKVTRGKTNLLNAALVTPRDIADSAIAGQFSSDATSITKYGARSVSYESLITDGSAAGASWGPTTDAEETKLMADGIVANYKDPKTRISEVTFRPKLSGARATRVWALMCGVELNDVFTVTTTHPGGGGFTAEDQFVESVHYEWDVLGGAGFTNVTLTVELSPRSHWTTNPFT